MREHSMNLIGAPPRPKRRMEEVENDAPDAYEIPSWALAILFWRKVLAVESKGIPGTRGPRHDHDLATETHFGDPNSAEGDLGNSLAPMAPGRPCGPRDDLRLVRKDLATGGVHTH